MGQEMLHISLPMDDTLKPIIFLGVINKVLFVVGGEDVL
jgi:hypothetical protein